MFELLKEKKITPSLCRQDAAMRYNTYDFEKNLDRLNFSADSAAKSVLTTATGFRPETLIFSDKFLKTNKRGKEQEREIMITDRALYNFKRGFVGLQCQRRIGLEKIHIIVASRESPEFLICAHKEHRGDYRLQHAQKSLVLAVISRYHPKTGIPLNIVWSNEKNFEHIAILEDDSQDTRHKKAVMQMLICPKRSRPFNINTTAPLGLKTDGVIVRGVVEGKEASKVGIRKGMIFHTISGKVVPPGSTSAEVEKLLKSAIARSSGSYGVQLYQLEYLREMQVTDTKLTSPPAPLAPPVRRYTTLTPNNKGSAPTSPIRRFTAVQTPAKSKSKPSTPLLCAVAERESVGVAVAKSLQATMKSLDLSKNAKPEPCKGFSSRIIRKSEEAEKAYLDLKAKIEREYEQKFKKLKDEENKIKERETKLMKQAEDLKAKAIRLEKIKTNANEGIESQLRSFKKQLKAHLEKKVRKEFISKLQKKAGRDVRELDRVGLLLRLDETRQVLEHEKSMLLRQYEQKVSNLEKQLQDSERAANGAREDAEKIRARLADLEAQLQLHQAKQTEEEVKDVVNAVAKRVSSISSVQRGKMGGVEEKEDDWLISTSSRSSQRHYIHNIKNLESQIEMFEGKLGHQLEILNHAHMVFKKVGESEKYHATSVHKAVESETTRLRGGKVVSGVEGYQATSMGTIWDASLQILSNSVAYKSELARDLLDRVAGPLRDCVAECSAECKAIKKTIREIDTEERAEALAIERAYVVLEKARQICERAHAARLAGTSHKWYSKATTAQDEKELREDLIKKVEHYMKLIENANNKRQEIAKRRGAICKQFEKLEGSSAAKLTSTIQMFLLVQKDTLTLMKEQCIQLRDVVQSASDPGYPSWDSIPLKNKPYTYQPDVTLSDIRAGRYKPNPRTPVFEKSLKDQIAYQIGLGSSESMVPVSLKILLEDIKKDDRYDFPRDLSTTNPYIDVCDEKLGEVSPTALLEQLVFVRLHSKLAPGAAGADSTDTKGVEENHCDGDTIERIEEQWAGVNSKQRTSLLAKYLCGLQPPLVPPSAQQAMMGISEGKENLQDSPSATSQMKKILESIDEFSLRTLSYIAAAVNEKREASLEKARMFSTFLLPCLFKVEYKPCFQFRKTSKSNGNGTCRDGPGFVFRAIGDLEDGEILRVLEENGTWVRHAKGWTVKVWDKIEILKPCNDPEREKQLQTIEFMLTVVD
ncbi:hypothetical protein AAMO2058_001363700 [Amorphochlora amoebiformis]